MVKKLQHQRKKQAFLLKLTAISMSMHLKPLINAYVYHLINIYAQPIADIRPLPKPYGRNVLNKMTFIWIDMRVGIMKEKRLL